MISVIIPIYNAEKELPGMLACLLGQTERDFEVLLVDDGSKDGSGQICDEIAEKDNRFRAIRQSNAGVSAARNRGLSEAKGEYITFLDADDAIDSWYLATLLTACLVNNADISVCDVALERNGVEQTRFTLSTQVLSQEKGLNCLLSRQGINTGPCAKLFRKTVLVGVAFPPLRAYEDILFVKDAFCRAKKIAATDKTTYHYIENSEGAMSQFAKAPSLDIVKATDQLLEFYKIRKDLRPVGFYITASHLMQYVIPMLPTPTEMELPFLNAAQNLYRKYWMDICRCEAFPWKEKVVYLAFAIGIVRNNGRFVWLQKE